MNRQINSTQRDRQVHRSVVLGIVFQATYVLVQFIILAVFYRHLGEERFGMWITIFGLTMWVNLLSLGMNYALLSWLGRIAYNQPAMVWRVIIAVVRVVSTICALAALLMMVLGWRLPWPQIFQVQSVQAVLEATPTAVAALVMMCLAIPAQLGGMVLQSCQRGDVRYILGIGGQLIGLVLVMGGVWRGWSLPVLGVLVISPIMIAGMAQWWAAYQLLPKKPAMPLYAERVVGPMLVTGFGLWVLDVALILTVNSGPLLVAQSSGAISVPPYAAVYRLIGPFIVCFMVISHTYWPAIGDAFTAKDHPWIARALWKSAAFMLGIWLIGAAVCLSIGQPFIAWWLGPNAVPTYRMIAAGLILALTHGVYYWSLAGLSGLGHVRVQVVTALLALTLYVTCSWTFVGQWAVAETFFLQAACIGLASTANAIYLGWVLRNRIR